MEQVAAAFELAQQFHQRQAQIFYNVHYTKGGPWFEDYAKCDYSQDWFRNLEESNGSGV